MTVLGVMVGIAAIVFLVAFAFGIEQLVTSQVTQGNAYQLVDVGTGGIQALLLNQDTIDKLKTIGQIQSIEPTIDLGAKAKVQDRSTDVTLSGTSDQYMNWSGLTTRWGTGIDSAKIDNPLVVNSAFVKFMGSNPPESYIGQKVAFDLVITKEITGADAKTVTGVPFTVVGVISNQTAPAVYTRTQNLIALGANNYSQIKVESTTQDPAKITALRTQIENLGLKTQYVGDTVAQINQIFQVFKIILGSFGLIALIVATLGMFNTLTISLLERTKEVALLKILGMRNRDISSIFLTEAISIGTFGGLIGLAWGYLLGLIANDVFNYFATKSGGQPVSVFLFPLWFMLSMLIFAVFIGFLTGIYPARRATKINALDVLRYE